MAIVVTNLRAEAAAEAARVAAVRAFIRQDDARQLALLEGGRVWLAKARRGKARRALRGRIVLVWRVAMEDAAGRLVASTLVPVAVDVARHRRIALSRSKLHALVAELERATRPLVDRTAAAWQQVAVPPVHQFSSARLARERATARRMSTASADRHAYQPGLFDRRVERERRSDAVFAATSEHAMAERLLAVEELARITPRSPRLLLVLVP
jgi:hypothetical protein